MKTRVNYKGIDITEIYKLALIGAEFVTEKNENGIMVVNPLSKELYAKTVLLTRFLKVVDLPQDRVMSLEQYKDNDFTVASFACGRNTRRLKADYDLFTSMLDDEITNRLACENDAMTRFDEAIAFSITPEKIKGLEKQKDELIAKLNKISK
ncbi:MAG: hypothetical protein J6D26_01025 [Clostridia bacterium]|nr:hypothetical protein [Clostridia bacterium]